MANDSIALQIVENAGMERNRGDDIPCLYCDRFFRTKIALKRHQKNKLLCARKRFLCEHCHQFYKSKESLRSHQAIFCLRRHSKKIIRAYTDEWLMSIPSKQTEENLKPLSRDFIKEIYTNTIFESQKQLQWLSDRNTAMNDKNKREIISILLFLYTQQQITMNDTINILLYL